MKLVLAITRGDVADYVDALVFVYFVLILLNIVLSWIQQFRPIPYNLTLRAVINFVEESTNPYLNVFRRWVPRIGPLDISPIIATIVLFVVGGIVVNLIRG
jgi:YggT family protein